MRVDIIIDNHNYARFLRRAIDSALAQTHPDVRVIVVDDGSTDDSAQIIASYGEQIVPVLKANGGQGSAFNAGFAVADADVVMFVDSDDVLDPGVAAHVATAVAEHPNAAKIQWRMALIDADGRPMGRVLPAHHIPLPQGDMRRAELTFPFDIAWMATSGNAFPASALRRIMPMPELDYRLGADSYLRHLTALLGPVVSLHIVGSHRRVHGGNAHEQLPTASLDLEHVHETIRETHVTLVHLEELATRLGLYRHPGAILSVSDLANRLISLRIDRGSHPVAHDNRLRVAIAGARAALRRFDVHPPLRAALCAWFLATAVAPRRSALWLGQLFLFPEQRANVNRLLPFLHAGHANGRP